MAESLSETRKYCLWHAKEGRCASCKARKIRLDVLQIKDYEMCRGEEDYSVCEFYKEKPVAPERNK